MHRQTRTGGLLWKVALCVLPLSVAACSEAPPPLEVADLAPSASESEAVGGAVLRRAARPVPQQYIVVLNPATRDVRGLSEQLTRLVGGTRLHVYEHALKGFAVRLPAQAVPLLLRNPHVRFIEEDGLVSLDVTTQTSAPWSIDRIDQRTLPLNSTYSYAATGAGVNVYVIDSGIRYGHREFEGRASLGVDFIGDGVAQRPGDCLGHGTYVAGLVGGNTYGAAKQARLISVRVFDCEWITVRSRIIAGVEWVTANAVKPAVVNMSLSESVEPSPELTSLDLAVENSIASGLVYTVSAGNLGGDACLRTPARAPSAITTGATTTADARASFSNFGTCVDIFAPGDSVRSASYGGNSAVSAPQSGTSAAAPHVAGVAAMYLQEGPNATPAEVRQAILSQASSGGLTNVGTGSPNLLLYSQIGQPPPPVVRSAMHTLVDDFRGRVIDSDRWQYYHDPSRTSQNDRLIVTLPRNVEKGYGGLRYRLPHGFANSSFMAEVSQVASGAAFTETSVGVSTSDLEEYVSIASMGGKIGAYYKWRGQNWVPLKEITFNPTSHRFRRIREQGGTIYFEVSANGSSWTQPSGWSVVHRFTDVNSLLGVVAAGAWFADPNPGVAVFENVNTTVPAIPSGLTATAVSGSRIDLAWQDRSVNESGFAIERRVLPGGSFTQVATVGANVTQYQNSGLQAGTTYEYRVRASSSSGNSGYTNTASATTSASAPVNQAPVARAGGTYTGSEGAAVQLDGSASSDPDGDALSYSWSFGDGSTATGAQPRHTFRDNGSYMVVLTVTDARGASSKPDTTTATIANVAPAVSMTLSASTVRVGEPVSLSGSFADPGVQDAPWSLEVEWGDGTRQTGSVTNASTPISGSRAYSTAGTYTVRLRVTDKDGGTGSASRVVTVENVSLAAPSGLTARAVSAREINLAWTDNSASESGFQIDRHAGDGRWSTIRSTGANVTSYRDTGLQAGTTYTYRVRALENGGSSAWSNSASARTNEPPAAPQFQLQTSGYKEKGLQKASLAWSGTSALRFEIFRNGVRIATVSGSGQYTDHINLRGSGSYVHQVCEAGTQTCSNITVITF